MSEWGQQLPNHVQVLVASMICCAVEMICAGCARPDLHVMDGLEPPPHPAILVEAGSLILLVLGYGLSPTGSYGYSLRQPCG